MRTALRIALFCSATLLVANSSSRAQSTGRNEKIALTGEAASSGGTYSSFAPPVLNNSSQAAFEADTAGGPTSGIYRGTVGGVSSIAVQGAAAPGGDFFEALDQSPVINDAGQVAFLSTTFDGPSEGVYLGTESTLQAVALAGRPAPSGGTFSDFLNPAINSLGQTAFLANVFGGPSLGMHFATGGVVSDVAVQGDAAPGGGTFVGFSVSQLNSGGQMVWRSDTSGGPGIGIYLGSTASVGSIALKGGSAPGGGTYENFGLPLLNSTAQAAFFANTTGGPGSGIYLGTTAGVSPIALQGSDAPGGGTFTSLSPFPDPNNAAQVAFSASTSSGLQGVYLGTTSALQRVAVQNGSAPGGGAFLNFFNVTLNEPGAAVFFANLTSGGQGIYLGDGIDLVKAVASGNALAGSTVTAVALASGTAFGQSAINDLGQVAYRAFLANGNSGVFLFTPALHWRAPGDESWNTAANWTLGIDPAAVHDVFIDPANALVVTGPNDNVTVRSLQVGGGSGAATLNLLPDVTLTAPEGVVIVASGVLSGDGTIAAAVSNSGRVKPGASLGLLTITGDFTQTGSGFLEMELGGLAPGAEHDKLAVSGNVTLAGTLEVTLFGAFNPAEGDSFDLLDWGSESGVFSALNLPPLDAGLTWDTSNLYNDGSLMVVPEPCSCALALSTIPLIARRGKGRGRRT